MSVFLAFGEQAHNCLLILFRSHTHTHPPSNFIHSLVCFAEMQNDVIANFICGFFVSTINVGGFVAIPMLRVRFIFCSPMILAYEFVSFNWIVVLYPFSRFFSFDFPLDAALFRRQSVFVVLRLRREPNSSRRNSFPWYDVQCAKLCGYFSEFQMQRFWSEFVIKTLHI